MSLLARVSARLVLLLVVAAPSDAQRGSRSGAHDPAAGPVNAQAGAGAGSVRARTKVSSDGGFPQDTLDWSDLFGKAMARIGDVDGDGVQDLAVGIDAFEANGGLFSGATIQGGVLVLFLRPDGGVERFRRIDDHAGVLSGELGPADRFGSALAPLGDLDGDGTADLAVGAVRESEQFGDTFYGSGSVWILFLRPDGTVREHASIPARAGSRARSRPATCSLARWRRSATSTATA